MTFEMGLQAFRVKCFIFVQGFLKPGAIFIQYRTEGDV
jgi:hypothetical protein